MDQCSESGSSTHTQVKKANFCGRCGAKLLPVANHATKLQHQASHKRAKAIPCCYSAALAISSSRSSTCRCRCAPENRIVQAEQSCLLNVINLQKRQFCMHNMHRSDILECVGTWCVAKYSKWKVLKCSKELTLSNSKINRHFTLPLHPAENGAGCARGTLLHLTRQSWTSACRQGSPSLVQQC